MLSLPFFHATSLTSCRRCLDYALSRLRLRLRHTPYYAFADAAFALDSCRCRFEAADAALLPLLRCRLMMIRYAAYADCAVALLLLLLLLCHAAFDDIEMIDSIRRYAALKMICRDASLFADAVITPCC